MKYAIKVPFDDGYLYVLEDVTDNNDPKPLLFDDETTAKAHAKVVWGDKAKVVEYED